uniref:TBC1 domain family member 16-like n=1 Tax=Panthera onca TaxID=9690 RepID=UPI002952AF7C
VPSPHQKHPAPIGSRGWEGQALPGVCAAPQPRAGALLCARLSMTPEEHRAFWRNVQFTVDKDVVRTDRSNQFFRGEDNPNVESMRRILLNYAVYNPAIGYSQGMSDLVAPILAEVLDESDTFWCFVGLMQNTIFVSSPRDEDMEKQLVRLGAGGHSVPGESTPPAGSPWPRVAWLLWVRKQKSQGGHCLRGLGA